MNWNVLRDVQSGLDYKMVVRVMVVGDEGFSIVPWLADGLYFPHRTLLVEDREIGDDLVNAVSLQEVDLVRLGLEDRPLFVSRVHLAVVGVNKHPFLPLSKPRIVRLDLLGLLHKGKQPMRVFFLINCNVAVKIPRNDELGVFAGLHDPVKDGPEELHFDGVVPRLGGKMEVAYHKVSPVLVVLG